MSGRPARFFALLIVLVPAFAPGAAPVRAGAPSGLDVEALTRVASAAVPRLRALPPDTVVTAAEDRVETRPGSAAAAPDPLLDGPDRPLALNGAPRVALRVLETGGASTAGYRSVRRRQPVRVIDPSPGRVGAGCRIAHEGARFPIHSILRRAALMAWHTTAPPPALRV